MYSFWLIKLSNAFVFPDPEPSINILYGWSGICDQFWSILIVFFYVFFWNTVKINHFCIVLLYCYIYFFFFLHIRSSLVLYACICISIESIDCIFLSSSKLNTILLTSSVNTLCFTLLNLCCDLNIIQFLLWILHDFLDDYLHQVYLFLDGLFYFQVEFLLNNVYNLQF